VSKYKKKLLIAAGVCAALLLFTITILPLIVRNKAVTALEETTGRKVRIEKVAINPFTLTVTVKGFALAEQDGGPFVAVGTVRTSLGMASIYKRALILSQVSLDAPALTFARLAANSYSFNDIIERLKAKPKKESTSPFLFSLNNISITNGSIDFLDRAVDGGRNHTVRNLNIAVPFISNIPYLVEKYTDPHISAIVNNAPFNFEGKVKPLSKSMETSVHVDLRQLKLPEYMAYLPVKPPVTLAAGSLTIDSELTYRISQNKKPELGITGLLRLDNIAVDLPTGKPLLKLPLFQVKAAGLEAFARRFLFDAVTVEGLELFVSRDNRGAWMFSKLLPGPAAAPAPKLENTTGGSTAQKKTPPLVQIASFGLKGGVVHFTDAQPSGGFKTDISGIDVTVKNISTASGTSAEYELSLIMDKEASLSSDGNFSLAPLTVDTSTELTGLKIQRGWPYLAQFLSSPVKGSVDAAADARYSKEDGLTVEQASLLATGLSARYGDKDGFDLSRFEIKDAGFSQKDNRAEIGEVKLASGTLSLSREADGSISLLSLLKKPQAGQHQQPAAADKTAAAGAAAPRPGGSPKSKQAAQGLKYVLKKLQVDRFTANFIDKKLSDKPRITLKNTSLSLTNLTGPVFRPSPLRFSSTLNKGTPLKASGTITPQPFRYTGSVSVGRLPLRDFEAYFPSNINVFILGGFADTSLNVDIALKDNKPTGSFKGTAGIRAFHAIDTVAEEDLLRWESLQLDGIQGSLEPFNLALKEIALNGVYSRIIIRKDGTLNLQNLIEKPAAETTAKPQDKPSPPPAPPAATAAPTGAAQQAPAPKKQIRIDAVTIQDGTLAFTDNHLPQHFATTFYNLGGRVSGLSSEEVKLADVDLRGNLENHSPLQITGQINPLRDDLFVDLKVAFRDIELSPVTPYSGTYLGYTVEKGKLYLDLKYRIDKKQLDASNTIFIDQFTFGEKVESDKATKLPVKLGLALLKDRKGEIHLDVPVTGRTDDPKFSIWRLVFQVLKNLMVKAVTSPFSLLSSMFGGGQDFSAIQFDHGTSRLSSSEVQKLDALAKVLLDRPALKVELKGYVDREKDTEAYRRELLTRKLRNEKFLALAKSSGLKEGQKADEIQVTAEETPALLKAVYRKEKFPKPRNMLGMVKDLPPDEMRKLIITNTLVGETELQGLARERVVAVLQHLVSAGKIPAERVFQKNDDIFKTPEKDTASRSRVELNAIAP